MVVATKGRIACVHLEFGDRKEKEVDQKIVDWRDDQNKSDPATAAKMVPPSTCYIIEPSVGTELTSKSFDAFIR
jgi:hypothetical protein